MNLSLRIILPALIVMSASCGGTDSKGTPLVNNGTNNASSNNASSNNASSNNASSNNASSNNSVKQCPAAPDPTAEELLLGFVGLVVDGSTSGTVTAVEPNRLALFIDGTDGEFHLDGGDLTELFEVDDAVTVTVTDEPGALGQTGFRRHSVAGPTGEGAEVGWGMASWTDIPLAPTVDLPLSVGSVTFADAIDRQTCAVESDCGPQVRTRSVFALRVTYRGVDHQLEPGEDLLDDEYSFRHLGASSTDFEELVSNDDCVAEGGGEAFFVVTAWGRVFLP